MIGLAHSFTLPAVMPPSAPVPQRLYGRPSELCQLCTDWAETRAFAGEAVVERKYDGIRAIRLPHGIFTRGSMPIAALDRYAQAFDRLEAKFGEPMMFDGEWLEPGGFEATNRLLSDRGRVSATGNVYLFDAVPMRFWEPGEDPRPLAERRRILSAAIDSVRPAGITLAAGEIVEDCRLGQEAAQAVWAAGGEGVVVKRLASPYVRARTADWLRIKRKFIVECPIVGVEEGPRGGKRVVALYKGREIRVALLSKRMRDMGDAIIGKTASITAMSETNSGALRQPRLVYVND